MTALGLAGTGVGIRSRSQRYLPLVDRVTTRGEFSDLLWEMHGELGTSHAYESGGAYRPRPHYRQGKLGVDWSFDVLGGKAVVDWLNGRATAHGAPLPARP